MTVYVVVRKWDRDVEGVFSQEAQARELVDSLHYAAFVEAWEIDKGWIWHESERERIYNKKRSKCLNH